jgi:hypothetical protein
LSTTTGKLLLGRERRQPIARDFDVSSGWRGRSKPALGASARRLVVTLRLYWRGEPCHRKESLPFATLWNNPGG